MREKSAFNIAKQRTAKGEARQREVDRLEEMADILDLIEDEEVLEDLLKSRFGITRGHERYERIIATWRALHR
ncbi:MAG TPA: hypothetical protein VFA76_07640 [Terriglobales bacterium]|nr:hypothetical protein [Terriglobales bacterium]